MALTGPSGSTVLLRMHRLELAPLGSLAPALPQAAATSHLPEEARKVQASLSLLLLAVSGEVCLPVSLWTDAVEGVEEGRLGARSTRDLSCSWRESVTKGSVFSSVEGDGWHWP